VRWTEYAAGIAVNVVSAEAACVLKFGLIMLLACMLFLAGAVDRAARFSVNVLYKFGCRCAGIGFEMNPGMLLIAGSAGRSCSEQQPRSIYKSVPADTHSLHVEQH
jgi:hypothetical protein